MNRRFIAAALLFGAPAAGLWAAGCGDDEVVSAQDAGGFDSGGSTSETGPLTTPDAGDSSVKASFCGNSAGAPTRLLLSMNNASTSELVAFNTATKMVDGRLTYQGFVGLTSSMQTDPYLLEEANDVVARLNPQRPWEIVSSWNVAGDDAKDGGTAFAEPVAIAMTDDCSKAYVLRFNRNKIAVLDTTKTAEAGAPTSFLDLTSLVQTDDTDGLVEMTGAVYVPTKKRIYVLLANLVSKYTGPPDYNLLCSGTKPSIIAIDTTTGQLAPLGGTAPGGGVALGGFNPPLGTSLVYDATRDRLLVLSGGCNLDTGGGVAGAVQQRRVEEVDLSTNVVKTLVSLDDKNFPTGMVFVDQHRAVLTFAGPNFGDLGSAYFWDPTLTSLGGQIPGGFDYPANDGKGNLVGVRSTKADGGAPGPFELLSAPFGADAGGIDASTLVKLGENPFTDNTGLVSGAEVWPHP